MTRTQLINFLINKYKFSSYLEIGIGNIRENFDNIKCEKKTGVDPNVIPNSSSIVCCKSDDFFSINKDSYDIIFIDGDHRCEQVDKDINNSLNVLKPNGIIICHDCLPIIEDHQRKEPVVVSWTGDVWKSIAKLRITRDDLDVRVIDIDCGCGMITRCKNVMLYKPESSDIYTWDYYQKHKENLLNIVSEDSIIKSEVPVSNSVQYPKNFAIETSTICDLKCVMCTHSAIDFSRPKIFLQESIVEKIIPYLQHSESLQLHGIGEPLLSPSFWRILSSIPKTVCSSINSNFMNITDDKINKLVLSNLRYINISLDSPDITTYYKIRGGNLNNVIDNIKKLIKSIKENNSQLFVMLNMTLMKENIEQINQMIDLCKFLECMQVDTWPMNNWKKSEVLNREFYGWKFIYDDQLPWKFKELYNEKIKCAIEYAKHLDIRFTYNLI